MALRADDGAVVTDCSNMANYYASVYRTDEGRDHPSLPELSTIVNAPHFTQVAVHKAISTLDAAYGLSPADLHPFTLQILADFLVEPFHHSKQQILTFFHLGLGGEMGSTNQPKQMSMPHS